MGITNPHSDQYFSFVLQAYETSATSQLTDFPFTKYAIEAVQSYCLQAIDSLQIAIRYCSADGGPDVYEDIFKDELQMFLHLLQACKENREWSKLEEAYQAIVFKRLPPASKNKFSESLIEGAKRFREVAKVQAYTKGMSVFFARSEAAYINDLKQLHPYVEEMIRLTKLFIARFSKAKKQQGIVDFNDIEHFCLEILLEWDEDKRMFVPSEVAQMYQGFFAEVFVDEYQDTDRKSVV